MYNKDEGKSKRNVKTYAKRAKKKIVGLKAALAASHRDEDAMPHSGDHDDHRLVSVRETMYRGKHIVVKTHYEITIDGKPFGGHFEVSDNGNVHYHGLPNYAFPSMMDLIRKVIDASNKELPEDEIGKKEH